MDTEKRLLLVVAVGALPAVLRDVEDHAVRVLELALEVAGAFVAEVEEELAAGRLDPLLRLDQVVDLDAEMVGADEGRALLQVGRRVPPLPEKFSSAMLMTPSLM